MPAAVSTFRQRALALELLKIQVSACRRCPLGSQRLQTVSGVGNPSSKLLFLGEGPGFDEDHQGEPFIGKAGQLLNKMIQETLGAARRDFYISNILKCHAMVNPATPEARGNDRPPTPAEMGACRPWWEGEIEILQPRFICLLGSSAVKAIFGETATISAYRGRVWTLKQFPGVSFFATYHPAAILRNPDYQENFQSDWKRLKNLLDES